MRGLAQHHRFVALSALLLSLAACSATQRQGPADAAAEGSGSGGASDASASSEASNDAVSDARAVDVADDVAEDLDAQADSAGSPDGSADAEGSDVAAEETAPPIPSGPWIEIGQGELGFERVDEDTLVSCIFGPQGSYHVWAAIRLHNIVPSTIRVEMQADIAGTHVGTGFASPLDSEWSMNPDGTADIFGQFLYLDFGIDFPALSDQPVTLTASVGSPSFPTVAATATSKFSCLP